MSTFSVSRKNCYLVSAGDLQHRYGHQEDSGKRLAPGLLIGCHIDVSTGVLSFTVNGKEVANKFQVSIHSCIMSSSRARKCIMEKLKNGLKEISFHNSVSSNFFFNYMNDSICSY